MHIFSSNIINYKRINVGVRNFYSNNKKIVATLLFILFYIALYFLIDFSTQSLVAHDEGLYARRARLIEYSDNWFSPPFSEPHHKTLGSYWFTALAIRIFGNSELALRLPSIVSSFLCLICTYLIALKITSKKSALISVCSLSSMPLWIQYSRYASPDLPFVFCILLSILFFLKSLDPSQFIRHYFFILLSGLFISTSFFIRSYMVFIPFIGLSPFIFFNLYRKDNFFKILFLVGILLGSLPTFINLYFSFQRYGIIGITSLFDFAKKQAIGDFNFSNLLLLPINFLYLTFPVGILFLILFAFTRSNNKINYPLLIYCYPLISLTLLLCMSTSYPHYYLFLLPSVSILFANYISFNSFRFNGSHLFIKYLLFFIIIFISSILLLFIFNYNEFIINLSFGNPFLLYFICSILLFSYITSLRFLLDIYQFRVNILGFFYNLVIPQYIAFSLLFNFGLLGNPNYNTKLFLNDDSVSSIINSNTIYLFSVDSKIQTLLSYYLPFSKVIEYDDEISNHKYVITSDKKSLDKLYEKPIFKTIKKFDNHILLRNIGK